MAFEIGDKVIYPNHGLGIIERIETKTIMGTTCGFYQLRMANETTVFVPVDNVDGVGLRRAITDVEVETLFLLLGDGKIDSHQNWKGRFKDNSDRMRTGSIYDVVEVLKSLTFLSKSKSLSFREKRMLDRAKFLVVSEITEVLGEKTPEVEGKVEVALDECFATKAKNAARAKAEGPRTKPVEVPPVVAFVKPVEATPVAKPVEAPRASKPVETPRPSKSIDAPRASKPVEAPRPSKSIDAPRASKSLDASRAVKPAAAARASKPVAKSPKPVPAARGAKPVDSRRNAKTVAKPAARPTAARTAAPRRAARAS